MNVRNYVRLRMSRAGRYLWSWALALAGIWVGPGHIGCVEGFDSASGADEAYYRLYDYRIDRPRVIGIRYTPLIFGAGDTVTFSALAVSPEAPGGATAAWWGCGVTQEEPFSYVGTDCLETSLAEYLGVGTSLSLDMPQYDGSTCEATGCFGLQPVFAIISSDESGELPGYGTTYLMPDYAGEASSLAGTTDLDYASLRILVDGLEALAEGGAASGYDRMVSPLPAVRPGQRVSLEVEVQTFETDYLFSWYVSAGELEQLGVTRAGAVDLESRPRRNIVRTRNALAVPRDQATGALFVHVVIDPLTVYYPGLERFLTVELQVQEE